MPSSATDSASDRRPARTVTLKRAADHWIGRFRAMASPCEVLIDSTDRARAESLIRICADEAWRIEDKFSRYLAGNVVSGINNSAGGTVCVDEETAGLLDFAATLHEISAGLFDITSGVLREVWTFDGSDRLPTRRAVACVLPRVGFDKLRWRKPELRLAPGMQIDFGGIGKEYAVDRAMAAVASTGVSCMINFGGDLCVNRFRSDGQPWRVGIENAKENIALTCGAIATSGDARRYLEKDGRRYSHILDPKTGWPIEDAPHSLTVVADTCTQAGMLATLAMLKGAGAEMFLESQSAQFWSQRH